jgi:ABC-2 type transport system permease protein
MVLSSKAQEIAGEIARGDLSNYLLKPINYFKYWFVRDISTKVLNLAFALIEAVILYVVLKPTLIFPPTFFHLLLFGISLCLAVIIFFFLQAIFASFTFWFIEQSWGFNFLLLIFIELMGGILFPLDILPLLLQKTIYLTPFAYLVYTPLQIYLGKFDLVASLNAIVMSLIWVILLSFGLQKMWNIGVKNYRAEGR